MTISASSVEDVGLADWIGPLPPEWSKIRLKWALKLITDKVGDGSPKVALENIQSWTGRYVETVTEYEGDGTNFRSGDILFGKLRPYLAKALLAEAPGQAVGDFHVLRPQLNVQGRFAQYYLLSRELIAVVDGSTYGAKMPRASWDFMANLPFPRAPLAEQTAIAAFLDRETGKIDALVEEQRRLIELLREKRQAVISHAVTKGLDPNATMKPSGVEWLGDVPAHWEVVQVRRILEAIEQGWSPDCESRPAEPGEWGVLKAGCANGSVFREEENKALPVGLDPIPELEVRLGDVLMSRANGSRENVGATAYVDATRPMLMLSDKVFRLHPAPGVSPQFLALLLGSRPLRHQIERAISGADGLANNLPQSALKSFIAAMPPLDEQEAIVRHVASQVRKLTDLGSRAAQAVDLLAERRTALISAAVTGKIDVRDGAAGEVAA
ncbi:hypothetical protein [uncultured Roseibium sp.]|uniref:hypothetical protein n=1 Tax=uncultured Roseibium sp. TaxID=1936171 RepID=UPI003217B97C